jgi:DNA-binding HxlR family transcriptional regulator
MRSACSIARSLEVLGEKWTLLLVREALGGVTRFAEFRSGLGIAPDILAARLGTLVDAGVFQRVPYREPGSRQRHEYHLTAAGRELRLVLGALQQWGDLHRPSVDGPGTVRRAEDGRALEVAFVDERGSAVPLDEVRFQVSDGDAPARASARPASRTG